MKENNNEVNEMNKDEKIKKEEYQMKLQDFKEFRECDITPGAKLLAEAIQDNEFMEKVHSKIIEIIDGKPVNKNPLSEIPESDMRLYSIGNDYFESIDELLEYCRKNHKTSEGLTILDYYKNLAGRSDVIRVQNNKTSIMYSAVDEDGYGLYNNKRSIYKGKFIWEYNYGSIRNLYKPFKERRIDFVIDVYGKIDEREQNILRYFKEHNLADMWQNN